MPLLWAMLCGTVAGLLATVPFALALRARRPSVALGLVAVLLTFCLLTLAIVTVARLWPPVLVPFGASAVLTFLVLTTILALRRCPPRRCHNGDRHDRWPRQR